MNTNNPFTDTISTRIKTGATRSKALVTFSLILLALSPVAAQNASQPQQRTLPAVQIGEQSVQLPPAKIPPRKMVLIPRTGKPGAGKQAPPKTIVLPDGTTARVSDLRRQFATEEAQLNSHDLTLFDPNQPIMDLEPAIDYGMLERQRQELLQHENAPEAPGNGDRMLLPMSGGVGSFYYPWSWSAGDPNYFQVSLDCYLDVFAMAGFSANPYFTAWAEGTAGGAILGNKITLADAYVDAKSSNGYVSGDFSLQVLGNYIINWSTSQSATWTWNWSAQQEVAEYYQTWIGPVPVSGRIGVRGSIGCSLDLGLYGDSIGAKTTPYASLSGFAEVGVGTWFAGAGIGGELTFLDVNFPVQAGAYLQWPNGQPQMVLYVKSNLGINTLSGDFYIWADLFGWSGRWTLWNWNGINWNGNLTNQSQTIDL